MPPRRGPAVLEVMIVVALAAVAVRLMMSSIHATARYPLRLVIVHDATIVAALMSWAVVLARLVPPRPDRAALLRPPGIAACFAAALGTLCQVLIHLDDFFPYLLRLGHHTTWIALGTIAIRLLVPAAPAAAVAATWLWLRVNRQWQPEPSWLDRFGRLVGASWLALLVMVPTAELLYYLG